MDKKSIKKQAQSTPPPRGMVESKNAETAKQTKVEEEKMNVTANPPVVKDNFTRITEVVVTAIESLQDGEKTTLKELQQLVAEQTGIKGSNIGPVISMVVKNHGGVTIELGRYGGIYKGIRTKAEKPADVRPRCAHCHQVIRQKTGPRKKKNVETVQPTMMATTEEHEDSNESDDSSDLEAEFEDFESDMEESDEDSDDEESE